MRCWILDVRYEMLEKGADSPGCDGKTDARCASSTGTIGFNVFRQFCSKSKTNNHPLCGCALKVIPKKSPIRYNKVFKSIVEERRFFMANQYNSLSHTKWLCKYHIVIVPKYRRKVIYKEYRKDLQEIIRTLCKYKGVEIIEGHMMPDHVHLLVSIPPKISVSSFMGYLKGKSALMMFDKHANLKYKFGNRHFWAEGYYVSTVGLNESTIKKYIQDQEKADIALDKLSVKEYTDPFAK